MEPFTRVNGLVAPLDRSNVDTDAIIPKQYLKSIERTGFGRNLFDAWRYLDRDDAGENAAARTPNPDFVLNQPRYEDAEVLLTRENFGCGSSREHAVWALADHGFRAIVGSGFADIFYNNCFKSGLLPVRLPADVIDRLFRATDANEGYRLTVDLVARQVTTPDGEAFAFEIDPFRRDCLLKGLDDIGLTLQYAEDIRAYETRRRREAPWMFAE